jgi:hypothetical protein
VFPTPYVNKPLDSDSSLRNQNAGLRNVTFTLSGFQRIGVQLIGYAFKADAAAAFDTFSIVFRIICDSAR